MEKLIEMVRGFPVLYDTSHADYMRAKLKDGLWEKIAAELNYSDAKDAKKQWRKLRECHRVALRRQQKKSGQQATNYRPWTYQQQMEFLKPFMKNRNTVENPISPLEESQLEEDDNNTLSDAPIVEAINDAKSIELYESATPKKYKKSTDPVMQKFIENSNKRSKKRDELRENFLVEKQKQEELQNDALYQFFMSMYNTTRGLPTKYQKEIKRKLFQAVSDAEDKAQDETEIDQNLQINIQHPLSTTTHSNSIFSSGITQEFPEFFSPSMSTSVSSVDERSCSRQENDFSRTFTNL